MKSFLCLFSPFNRHNKILQTTSFFSVQTYSSNTNRLNTHIFSLIKDTSSSVQFCLFLRHDVAAQEPPAGPDPGGQLEVDRAPAGAPDHGHGDGGVLAVLDQLEE